MAQATTFNPLRDESNDKGAPVELLTILVRIFESSMESLLRTRHLDTVAIIDLTANGIPYFLVIRRISLISAYSLLSACYFVGLSTRY